MVEAVFQYRKSKRLAEVDVGGELFDAYISNGADLKFMENGSVCYLREVDSLTRQTGYDLYSVYDKDTLVCVDAKEPLVVAKQWYTETLRNHYPEGKISFWEETRSLTLMNDKPLLYFQVMGTSLIDKKTAFLPDRPSSALNSRLEDLMYMKRRGHDCRLMIVVCRDDAERFSPNKENDYQFYLLLTQVINSGIPVDCLRCKVDGSGMKADQIIPVEI